MAQELLQKMKIPFQQHTYTRNNPTEIQQFKTHKNHLTFPLIELHRRGKVIPIGGFEQLQQHLIKTQDLPRSHHQVRKN